MKKRILAFAMLVVMLVSIVPFSAFAASSKDIQVSGNHSWSASVRCTLSKTLFGKTKDGVVRVTMDNWGVNLDIRMCNGGKVIWSENNSIRSSGKAARIYRDYNLGKNYSYYDLSFRSNRNYETGVSVTVQAKSNIKSINWA